MALRRFTVPVTTAADGSFTGYTPYFSGKIHTIRYVKTNFTDGYTTVMTADKTGESVWSEAAVNASSTRAPRAATHSTAGAAALYAGGGLAVNDRIALGSDRVKIVLATAGNATTGAYHFLVED